MARPLAVLAAVTLIAAGAITWVNAHDSVTIVPVQNKPVARPDGSEGDIPGSEALVLKEAALADVRVSAMAQRSSRLELFLVQTESGDEKWPDCPRAGVCAYLVFYDWDNRQTAIAWLVREDHRVVLVNIGDGRPAMTHALREQAVKIALADPDIAKFVGPRPKVNNVSDAGGSGSCHRNMCALVALTRTDGDGRDRRDVVEMLVDLHRQIVVNARTSEGVYIDWRSE